MTAAHDRRRVWFMRQLDVELKDAFWWLSIAFFAIHFRFFKLAISRVLSILSNFLGYWSL